MVEKTGILSFEPAFNKLAKLLSYLKIGSAKDGHQF
jgi:hypothetical protein